MNNNKIKNPGKVRFWKIAPGSGGTLWVEQRDNRCIAIGWNEMGDLDEYSNDEAIKKRFYEIRKNSGKKKLLRINY